MIRPKTSGRVMVSVVNSQISSESSGVAAR